MLTASDIMTTDVITVAPETPVTEIAKLLYTRRISGVPVVQPDGRIIGMVSDGDLMSHAQAIGGQGRSGWPAAFPDQSRLARG